LSNLWKSFWKIFFSDAPSAIYGAGPENLTHQENVLSDGAVPSVIYGFLGDSCNNDKDCSMENTLCLKRICSCQSGFQMASEYFSCESKFEELVMDFHMPSF